jgi:ribose transport system permease protein
MSDSADHPVTRVKDVGMSSTDPHQRPVLLASLKEKTAFWMFLVLILLVVLFSFISPHHVFLRSNNLFAIALNASQLILLAVGTTYLLAARELDLSIGANATLASVLAAQTITTLAGTPDQVANGEYPNLALAIIAGTAVAFTSGIIFGLMNGMLVTRLKINSFLVTLATTVIGLGISLVITHGADVPNLPRVLQTSFATYRVFGIIPTPVIISFTIASILWFVMSQTKFGVHTLAIGSSPEAARRAGVKCEAHLMVLFGLMGFLCGCAAMLDISRFATTNISGHQTDNLQAVAAAVIGGSSLFGGVASIVGAVVGTLIPVVLSTGLVIMRVDSFYQLIVVGVIVIVAIYIDQRGRKRTS